MVSECITGFDPSAHVFLEILTHPTLQRGNAFHAEAARFGSQLDSSQLKHGSVETFVIFTKCGMAGICFFLVGTSSGRLSDCVCPQQMFQGPAISTATSRERFLVDFATHFPCSILLSK